METNLQNKQQLAVPVETKSVMQQLIDAAKDIDVDKLKILQEMHEHAQDREAEKRFNIDFVAMKPHLPTVIKTRKNTQTNSKYAKLDDINKVIDPILEQYGFGTAHNILETNPDGVKVTVSLIHRDGHVKTTEPIWMPIDDKGMAGAKNKTLPHAISSSVMYARRIGECALLNISTGDDLDGNLPGSNGPITTEEAALLDNKVTATGADKKAFLEYFKVDDIRKIRSDQLKDANSLLDRKAKKKTNT